MWGEFFNPIAISKAVNGSTVPWFLLNLGPLEVHFCTFSSSYLLHYNAYFHPLVAFPSFHLFLSFFIFDIFPSFHLFLLSLLFSVTILGTIIEYPSTICISVMVKLMESSSYIQLPCSLKNPIQFDKKQPLTLYFNKEILEDSGLYFCF